MVLELFWGKFPQVYRGVLAGTAELNGTQRRTGRGTYDWTAKGSQGGKRREPVVSLRVAPPAELAA